MSHLPTLSALVQRTGNAVAGTPPTPAGGSTPGSLWPATDVTLPEVLINAEGGLNWDFDVTALPNNAAAVIEWTWVAFGMGAGGGLSIQINGIVAAYRASDGSLQIDGSGWAATSAAVPPDPVTGVDSVSAPDANTVRLAITGGGSAVRMHRRYSIAFVQCSQPVSPT